jgi:16S rRNA (cytosine1402-N4)-methyltransferase
MNTQDGSHSLQPGAFEHASVMLDEVILAIAPRTSGIYLDVTLGGAGHAEAVLRAASPSGTLVGIDRDPVAREHASRRLEPFGPRARVRAGTMRSARAILRDEGFDRVDGLIADLGVSSPQLDDPARGMSFRADGPLDMRMDPEHGESARELLHRLPERELADVIYGYGEERASRPIARAIKRAVSAGGMQTTRDLARAVYRVLGPPRAGRGIDPATRTFQAVRIAVNDELGELDALLQVLPELLADGGRAAFITFHSLEDRRVKHALRDAPELEVLTKKPLAPADDECRANPRARSAKLRVARRRARAHAEVAS